MSTYLFAELGDEWALASSQEGDLERIPLTDGSSFNVKYLGRTPVVPPHNQNTATKAINSILAMVSIKKHTYKCCQPYFYRIKFTVMLRY